jgi:transmembrane sensor
MAPLATVALVEASDSPANGLSVGDPIYPGEAIATDDSGIALTVSNGLLLRLDVGTEAMLQSAEELTLRSGRVYADTGQSIYGDTSITIRTSVGSATDIGTLFSVAHFDGDMSVAVREGRVDVSGGGGSYTAEAGDMLTLKPDDDVVFDKVPPYDSAWEWAEALAPSFDIENRTLLDFLKWAARETGKELVFEDDGARIAAMGTRLHGSVSDFTPSEAVESVLPTTKFAFQIDDRRIVIGSVSQ